MATSVKMRNGDYATKYHIWLFLLVVMAPFISHAKTDVIGRLYGVKKSEDGSGYVIHGWACQIGIPQSITIRVTFDKPAGKGVALMSSLANQPGAATEAAECGITANHHNFRIALSQRDVVRFAGRKIYIYGVAVGGDDSSNAELENSGMFALPDVAYDDVNCADWDGVVDRNIRLQPANCEINKQVVFSRPDRSLNCNGATLDGSNLKPLPGSRGQGIGVVSAKDTCERSDLVGIASQFPDADGSGSLISNCKIANFTFGIYLNRRIWTKPRPKAVCMPFSEFSNSSPQKGGDTDLDKIVGGRDRRYSFSALDVTVRNVEAMGSKQAGIFVNEYARNWLIEDSVVHNNGVGIYLERESQGSRIVTSTVVSNANVGIAIDASAQNSIEKNVIEKNGFIGVALYKNCGEADGVTRYQHSDHNMVRQNVIRDHRNSGLKDMTLTMSALSSSPQGSKIPTLGVGVWIASRQGLSGLWMAQATRNAKAPCSDAGYDIGGRTFYQDNASDNQVIGNTITGNSLAGVIVEDDNNRIIKNDLSSPTERPPLAGIIVGSIFRQQYPKLGPVRNVTLDSNNLPKATLGDSVMFIGGSKPTN